MTWDSDNTTAAEKQAVREALCVKIAFPSGNLLTTSCNKPIDIGADTYLSNGLIVSMGGLQQRHDLKLPPSQVAMAPKEPLLTFLADEYEGSRVEVYVAILDANFEPEATPELIGSYRLSTVQIRMAETEEVAALHLEHRLSSLRNIAGVVMSDADQRLRYASDDAWMYAKRLVNAPVDWGGYPLWVRNLTIADVGAEGVGRGTGQNQVVQ